MGILTARLAVMAVGLAGAMALAGGALGDEAKKERERPAPVTTEHEVSIAGAAVKYRATAGVLPLFDEKLKAKADVFYVAYERVDGGGSGGDAAKRPLTFAFNGGPGSSSVWLHLGALGPRRVKMGPEGEAPSGALAAPAELADNELAWLDFTDLVFIDPVSTGFSRAAENEDPHQFHGLEEDARAVGDFIRIYLGRTQRWLSPKFLCGESYGTTRAAVIAGDMQGRLGVYVNGIVLISPILNFQTASFDIGNDTAYPLFLPTYAATAWKHGKLAGARAGGGAAGLQRVVDEAREFADGAYAAALMRGDLLAGAEADGIAGRVAELTGVSAEFVKRCRLRPTIGQFTKELLRGEGRTVGRLDSRYTGIDRDGAGEGPEYDPSYAAIQGTFTAGLNAYVRGELKYESDLNYEILTGNVHPWNYPQRNQYANVAESLRGAMSANPNLRVLACSGYFDLATPFHAMTYTMSHMGLEASQRGRISQTFYACGHMMYVRDEDRRKLREDVKGFYEGR